MQERVLTHAGHHPGHGGWQATVALVAERRRTVADGRRRAQAYAGIARAGTINIFIFSLQNVVYKRKITTFRYLFTENLAMKKSRLVSIVTEYQTYWLFLSVHDTISFISISLFFT